MIIDKTSNINLLLYGTCCIKETKEDGVIKQEDVTLEYFKVKYAENVDDGDLDVDLKEWAENDEDEEE